MLKRDFLEKQLEQLGIVIARLIGQLIKSKNQGNTESVLKLADEHLKAEFELDLEKVRSAEANELIKLLEANTKLRPGHLSLLADLLYSLAETYEFKGDQFTAQTIYTKTLMLYEYVNEKDKTFSATRQEKINTLKSKS